MGRGAAGGTRIRTVIFDQNRVSFFCFVINWLYRWGHSCFVILCVELMGVSGLLTHYVGSVGSFVAFSLWAITSITWPPLINTKSTRFVYVPTCYGICTWPGKNLEVCKPVLSLLVLNNKYIKKFNVNFLFRLAINLVDNFVLLLVGKKHPTNWKCYASKMD